MQKTMAGLSFTSKVEGKDIVEWSFYDDYGVIKNIILKAHYIPSSTVRFFSSQHYFQQEKGGNFKINADGCIYFCIR